MTHPDVVHSFVCPHNDDVTILKRCPITECPFHVSRVSDLFTVDTVDTCCAYYDTTLVANVSNSRTQISALSRNPTAKISSKAVRKLYDDSLLYIRTLFELTNQVAAKKEGCPSCGYPHENGLKCVSTTVCSSRKEWGDFVISLYQIEGSISRRQLIWELLLKGRIHCEEAALNLGISLLPRRDAERLLADRKEGVGSTTGVKNVP